METLEQKKRRLFGKSYLPRYFAELSRLLKEDVHVQNLLSIVETDNFMNSVSYFKDEKPYSKNTIKFSDKTSLKKILSKEISDWNVPYMMYLSDSFDCGLLKISSLFCFNFDFSFYDEHAGIIIFTRTDGKEKILLDYYEENGEKYIAVEIYKKESKELHFH
jgi:hypothetical protein